MLTDQPIGLWKIKNTSKRKEKKSKNKLLIIVLGKQKLINFQNKIH